MSGKFLSLIHTLIITLKPILVYVSVALLVLIMGIGLVALWNSLPGTPPVSEYQQTKLSKAKEISRKDLSGTYGRVNKTIFNKKTQIVFSTPQEFFADSGMTSFDHLEFDEVACLPPRPRLINGRSLTKKEIESITHP